MNAGYNGMQNVDLFFNYDDEYDKLEKLKTIYNEFIELERNRNLTDSESQLFQWIKSQIKESEKAIEKLGTYYETASKYNAANLIQDYITSNEGNIKQVGKDTFLSWQDGLLSQAKNTGEKKELLGYIEKQFPDYAKYFKNLEEAKRKFGLSLSGNAISELNVSEMKRLLKLNSCTEDTMPTEAKTILTEASTKDKPHQISAKLDVKPSQHIISSTLDIKKTSYKIASELKIDKAPNKKIEAKIEIKPSDYKIKPTLNTEDNNSDDEYIEIEDSDNEYDTDLSPVEVLIVISLISIFATVVHHKLKSPKGDLGVSNNKESYSITYPNPPPIKHSNSESENTIVSDIEPEKHIFKCRNDLYKYITQEIDLTDYLGIDSKKVYCILPEHEDNDPSAHVYTNENGMQFYKCFGCGKARNIIGITEHLSGCKRSEAIEFIKNVYDLELNESDWTKQQKQLMIECANYLDTDEFKNEFPELYKLIRTRKSHIKLMLLHFSEMVNEDMQIEGKPFFFSSYPKLMEVYYPCVLFYYILL